jgi:hypothetical protein
LTHGHIDQIGSALTLPETWDVPIYAHRFEAPVLDRQITLSAAGSNGWRCACVSLAIFSCTLARLGRTGARTATRQSSRSNKLGMAPHSWSFVRSRLAISKFGSRASGGGRFCDSKHGFVERVDQRAAKAIAATDTVYH